MSKVCNVEGCENIARPMGWCNKHYRRWKKYGDPERTPYERAPNGAPEKFFREASESETNDCIVWPYGKDGDGYGFISGKATHREMCKIFYGEPEDNKDQACHSCNNPSCINPRHLRWATKSDNMQDKHLHGTMPMGETHWRNSSQKREVMTKSNIVDLDATLEAETEKARCFKFEEDGPDVWIPKSQHEWDEHDWMVSLPENVAIEKGLV